MPVDVGIDTEHLPDQVLAVLEMGFREAAHLTYPIAATEGLKRSVQSSRASGDWRVGSRGVKATGWIITGCEHRVLVCWKGFDVTKLIDYPLLNQIDVLRSRKFRRLAIAVEPSVGVAVE
jgi:hypothetical protein